MTPRLAADPPLRMRGSSVRTSTSQPTRPSVGAVMKGGYRAPVDPRPNTVSRRPRSLGVSGESEKGLAQIAQGLKSDQAPTYPAGVAGRGGHGERHRRRATAEREVLGIARRDEPRPPAPTAVQAARGGCAAHACLRRAYRRVRYRTVAPCRERETIGWGETNGLIAVVGCAWDALPAAIRGAA
jgi:hypothetical protein